MKMRHQFFAAFLLLCVLSGCRQDMFTQPSEKPLEKNNWFQDNQMASRPPGGTYRRARAP